MSPPQAKMAVAPGAMNGFWLREAPKKSPKQTLQEQRLHSKLEELEAADAERKLGINQDHATRGFDGQISDESTVSNALSGHSLETLSDPEFHSRQCSEIDVMASKVVFETKIKDAFRTALEDCQFCVTIADPRDTEVPLIAVSDEFEATTGFPRSEIIGKNCRALRAGCPNCPLDLLHLRAACKTGDSFSAVLTNRRKSGEYFLNLLDLRGLTVARNPSTGEELWFLVGIQADVTQATQAEATQEHLTELREVAACIRAKLVVQLKALAVAGALMTNFEALTELDSTCQDAWCILPEPTWKHSGHLSYSNPRCISPLLANPILSYFGVASDPMIPHNECAEALTSPSTSQTCTLSTRKPQEQQWNMLLLAGAANLGGAFLLHRMWSRKAILR